MHSPATVKVPDIFIMVRKSIIWGQGSDGSTATVRLTEEEMRNDSKEMVRCGQTHASVKNCDQTTFLKFMVSLVQSEPQSLGRSTPVEPLLSRRLCNALDSKGFAVENQYQPMFSRIRLPAQRHSLASKRPRARGDELAPEAASVPSVHGSSQPS